MSWRRRLGFSVVVALAAVGAVPTSAQVVVDPVIAAAGDIACGPLDPYFNNLEGTARRCRMKATAALLAGADAVLTLGDNQYPKGELANFQASYAPTWGQYLAVTHPSVGNHEYLTAGAAGYFGYFGTVAADPAKGYYSFDLGAWHLIAINSNCDRVGGCGWNTPQWNWLKADLVANSGRACTLAYWHHARYSSGPHGSAYEMRNIWGVLDAYGADVVLAGHDHLYERFAPQDRDAHYNARGIRSFVVGTGGKSLYGISTVRPNSVVRKTGVFGVLKLTLHPTSYDWAFVGIDGVTLDSGTASCV